MPLVFCLDIKTEAVTHVHVVRNGDCVAAILRATLLHERLPKLAGPGMADIVDRNSRDVFVGEDDVAVGVRGTGRCRPLEADECGEPAGLVGLIRLLLNPYPLAVARGKTGLGVLAAYLCRLGAIQGDSRVDKIPENRCACRLGAVGSEFFANGMLRESGFGTREHQVQPFSVIGHGHEIQRADQLHGSRCKIDALTLGESEGVSRCLDRAVAVGVERVRSVDVKVSPIDALQVGIGARAIRCSQRLRRRSSR